MRATVLPDRPPAPPERTAFRRLPWTLAGLLLGLGAPAGLLVLRRRSVRREVADDPLLYGYLTVSTCIAFASFGWVLARQEDRVDERRRAIEKLRRELAEVIAEELTGPLQVLLLQSDWLTRHGKERELRIPRAVAERMQQAEQRLARLLSDLLDTSRLDTDRMQIQAESFRVTPAVERIASMLSPELGHGVAVERQGWPGPILADPELFDRVLGALLENAARHSPPGAAVHVQIRPALEGTEVLVRDEGAGMPAKEIERLFDPLAAARADLPRRTGLALRLYLVKRLVEAQGGRLTVESAPGAGTTVRTIWPAAPESLEPHPAHPPA